MAESFTLALAQLNPVVGDVAGNRDRLAAARAEAAKGGADLVASGELALAGYPPEDLVLKPAFLDAIEAAAGDLAASTGDGGPALLVGTPWRHQGGLHNAVLLLEGGRIAEVRFKAKLPNYGVFDEKRLFAAGPLPEPLTVRGRRLGAMICEDMWTPEVAAHLAARGAEMLIVLNGSPFERDKVAIRRRVAAERAAETGLALAYVNQVGGQDELVFDGVSFAVDAEGGLVSQGAAWREDVLRLRLSDGRIAGAITPHPEGIEAVYWAMVTGLGDYVGKNGFPGVLLGLSGGIDSALSAAVAVDALGADKVHCVMMPSRYTSAESLEDAAHVARLLGVRLDTIGIEPAVTAFGSMLEKSFAGAAPNIAEENIQARARGVTLMALSNKFGRMVLSTGNKSEMSAGYATLYGDMCGGYSVLKDVYKTTVFALSRWRNAHRPDGLRGPAGPVMPERVIVKPPTAELRPNQKDQDSLPPYEVLDAILERLIEGEMAPAEIEAQGFERAVVERVWHMLDAAEYKRRQAPPGVKITPRAFGRDRRYPITNRFRG